MLGQAGEGGRATGVERARARPCRRDQGRERGSVQAGGRRGMREAPGASVREGEAGEWETGDHGVGGLNTNGDRIGVVAGGNGTWRAELERQLHMNTKRTLLGAWSFLWPHCILEDVRAPFLPRRMSLSRLVLPP